jgi:hypothetical protein
VRIGDGNSPYLQIVVPDTPIGKDPIDSLQTMFINWKQSLFTFVDPFLSQIEVDPDTIPANGTSQAIITISPKNNSDTLLASGKQIVLSNTGAGLLSSVIDLGDGNYEATITAAIAIGTDTISAVVISGTDTVSIFLNAIVTYESPTSVNENLISPDRFYLFQNYPQPFNPSTKIRYQIPKSSFVSIKVFDALGREVATIVNEEKKTGSYEVEFSTKGGSVAGGDAYNYSSGIYFYTMKTSGYVETKKMILLK